MARYSVILNSVISTILISASGIDNWANSTLTTNMVIVRVTTTVYFEYVADKIERIYWSFQFDTYN